MNDNNNHHQPLRKKIKLGSHKGPDEVAHTSEGSVSNAADTTKKTESKGKNKRKAKRTKPNDRPVPKSRDFSADLMEYLRSWSNRIHGSDNWKFNKVLQNWSLDSCFDKNKVDKATFRLWLKYLPTIKGGALLRISDRLDEILLAGEDTTEATGAALESAGGFPRSTVNRARKVKEVLDFVRSSNNS